MIFVCLQQSVLQRTNFRLCSKIHLVSDCTALWCDGRTGHLVKLKHTVVIGRMVKGIACRNKGMVFLLLRVGNSPEYLQLSVRVQNFYCWTNCSNK